MFNQIRETITLSYEILTKNDDITKIRQYKISRQDHHNEFLDSYNALENGLGATRAYLTKLSDNIEAIDLRIERLKFYIERDKEVRKLEKIKELEKLRLEREAKKQQKELEKQAAKAERKRERQIEKERKRLEKLGFFEE